MTVQCREALLAGLILLPGSWRPALLQPTMHASIVLKPLWYQFTEQSKNLHWPCTTPATLLWYSTKNCRASVLYTSGVGKMLMLS